MTKFNEHLSHHFPFFFSPIRSHCGPINNYLTIENFAVVQLNREREKKRQGDGEKMSEFASGSEKSTVLHEQIHFAHTLREIERERDRSEQRV